MGTTFIAVWDGIVVVVTTIAAVLIPLELVIGLQNIAGLFVFEIILTVIFTLDLFITFSRRVSFPGTFNSLVTGADILASLPFMLFPVAPALRLVRLFKYAKVILVVRHYWRQNVHQAPMLKILLFAYWLGLATHWLACGWLSLHGTNDGVDRLTNYISSVYFCVTTLTTVGFGDVTPANNAERVFVICMMLFGVAIYGFVIGNVVSMLMKMNPAKAHHIETMEKLEAFMKYKSLPTDLRKRLSDYHTYLWEQRLGYDESSIVNSLPPNLKVEVSLFLKRGVIQKVPLFKDAGDGFVREIALQMTPVVYMPGDYVVTAGGAGNEMFFVSRGTLEVISKDGNAVLSTLTDGDFFGEIALLLKEPRTASVRAVTYCDLYRLDRSLFERVLSNYPDVAEKIETLARARRTRE